MIIIAEMSEVTSEAMLLKLLQSAIGDNDTLRVSNAKLAVMQYLENDAVQLAREVLAIFEESDLLHDIELCDAIRRRFASELEL